MRAVFLDGSTAPEKRPALTCIFKCLLSIPDKIKPEPSQICHTNALSAARFLGENKGDCSSVAFSAGWHEDGVRAGTENRDMRDSASPHPSEAGGWDTGVLITDKRNKQYSSSSDPLAQTD